MSTPQNDDFKFDLTASDPRNGHARLTGAFVAVAGIAFIIATMTTGVSARILPMNEDYVQALVPRAPDGAEPLSLKALDHSITGNTITITGAAGNRTDFAISDVIAVIDLQEITGRFPQTIEAKVEPAEIQPQGISNFQASVTMQEKPAGYVIKFRLTDGPFLPHKDDRAAVIGMGN